MTTLTDREAQQTTSTRDVANATPWEVRMTDVKSWAEALDRHVERNLIEDNEVWFSITSGVATLNEVEGKPVPGGHRENPYFASRYVEVAYTARGKLHKLSVYCGVSWQREAPTEAARAITAALVQQCAEMVQVNVRAVSVVLSRHPQLEVHSGAALHLHAMDDGPWVAYPGTSIETPPSETCGVCGVPIHYSNERWRDERGRYEVLREVHGRFGPRKVLEHVHGPAEVQL
jgi:hypothetical protein